jgi:uncharacterized protein (DUF1501 family)
MNKRDFLRIGGIAGIGNLSLPHLFAQQKKRGVKNNKSVIIIWMNGGPSHHETFDPKPNASSEYKGHFNAISTNVPGIQISDHLNKSAAVMDKWSIIRGLYHGSNNHSAAHEFMYSGYKPAQPNQQENFYPSIGSVAAEHAKKLGLKVPPYVVVPNNNRGTRSAYLGQQYMPYETRQRASNNPLYKDKNFTLNDDLTIGRLDNRNNLLKSLDKMKAEIDRSKSIEAMNEFNKKAYDVLSSGRASRAFDINNESQFIKDMYGPGFGRDLLLARRLVQAGVKLVTVNTPFGWDTHQNSDKANGARNLPQFDIGFSALINDLYGQGMMEDVMVIAWGEFGRTPKINANGGRDHWSNVMSAAIAGGTVKGGRIAGASDKTGSVPEGVGIKPADVLATAYNHLGINIKHHYYDHSGRPIPILSEGEIIQDLI